MNGYPVMIRPEGSSRIIAFGTTGIVCLNSRRPEQVIKAPLRHKLEGCNIDTIETTLHRDEFAKSCFEREKIIYQILPKHPNILNCIEITDYCIHLPFMRHGNLREYLQNHDHEIQSQTREQWIAMAISAVSFVHSFGIVHADISARNFLVADDLSIKLCDFSGSAIGESASLVEEEDRYRMAPDSPRSNVTDIFALGCLIYEITTGLRPYDEIDDSNDEEIENRYSTGTFPCLDGVPYREIIRNCWTCQYTDINQLKVEFQDKTGVGRLFLTAFLSRYARVIQVCRLSFTSLTICVMMISGLLFLYPRRGYWISQVLRRVFR
jgi:serine/threonine protein kinase